MTQRDLTHIQSHVAVLRHVKQQKKILKELEDASKAVVAEAMAGADEGTVNGVVAVRIARFKQSRLDQKALKESHPELVDSYTITIPVERLDLPDTEEETP